MGDVTIELSLWSTRDTCECSKSRIMSNENNKSETSLTGSLQEEGSIQTQAVVVDLDVTMGSVASTAADPEDVSQPVGSCKPSQRRSDAAGTAGGGAEAAPDEVEVASDQPGIPTHRVERALDAEEGVAAFGMVLVASPSVSNATREPHPLSAKDHHAILEGLLRALDAKVDNLSNNITAQTHVLSNNVRDQISDAFDEVNGQFHMLDQQANDMGVDLSCRLATLTTNLGDLSISVGHARMEASDSHTTLDMKLNTLSTLGEHIRRDIREIDAKLGTTSALQDSIQREVRNLDDRLANLYCFQVTNHRDLQAELCSIRDGQVSKLVKDKVVAIRREARAIMTGRVAPQTIVLVVVVGFLIFFCVLLVSGVRGGGLPVTQVQIRDAELSWKKMRSEAYIKEFWA
ncbi:hypothetical protein K474DRAFT_1673595 [Panus rudis PR-1116 ss-1]|nr:hypothetical protein K474DRAFT_1673595 [Panus rudis PR-1116 ss-1]